VAIALAIAAIPAALGTGVLIGRSSGGGDAKLIAALRAEKAPVIEYSGAGAAPAGGQSAAVASANTATPVGTFTLTHGYAVQLSTLPAGSLATAASSAERSATAKGAKSVGVIVLADDTVKPRPSGAYVIYAGSSATRGSAETALKKLKAKFPAARVIEVTASGSSATGGGKVLTKTHFGSAHQVAGYTPNSSSLSQGSQVAAKDAHATGRSADGVGLPDVVSIP
jgi:hypothetical protein